MPAVKPPFPRLRSGHPLAQGLVGAWPLYEGGGLTVNDVSGQGNNGTLSGSTPPSWAGGQSGYCLSFDGATSYVSHPVIPVSTGYTWAHWVNGNSAPSGSAIVKTFVNGTNSSDVSTFCWSHTNSAFNQAAQHVNSAGSFFAAKITATLSAGVWYHIAGTWDGVSLRAYLNGTLQATTSVSSFRLPTTAMFLGRGGAGQFFPGLIDGMAIYSRALSPAEVAALYADSFAMFRPQRVVLKAAAAPAGAATQLLTCLGCGA